MTNDAGHRAAPNNRSLRLPTSNEYFVSVEFYLYAQCRSSQLEVDELDTVDDFAFQEFSAAACAQYIFAQRAAAV